MIHEVARAFDQAWWWFLHTTGADNPSGVEYGFWSGAGSDFGELTLVAGALALYRTHLNCTVTGCPWPHKHTIQGNDGRTYRVCHKHHPGVDHGRKVTQAHVDAAHAEHLERNTL